MATIKTCDRCRERQPAGMQWFSVTVRAEMPVVFGRADGNVCARYRGRFDICEACIAVVDDVVRGVAV